VSEEDCGDLKLTFALEAEAMPTASLGTAVDSLIADVSSKVFGKPVLEKEDSVIVDVPFGRTGGMRHAPRPLARWRKTIEAQEQYGQNILVHFCPLINVNSNHFTPWNK